MKNSVRITGLTSTTNKALFAAVLLIARVHAGDVPTIDKPTNFDPPTKEEGGILTTLVSSYMAVRNSVRFVYDEVTYFERMYDTYDEMTTWFDKNKERVENLFDASTRVFSDPENVFTTLRRMERIFDAVDELVLVEPRKFDLILSGGEKLVDVAAGRNNAYTGFIIPNTEGVLKYVEALFTSNEGLPLPDDEKAKMSQDEQDLFSLYNSSRKSIQDVAKNDWPEERVRVAASLIASSAMANSEAYNKWSIRANNHVIQVDKAFAGIEGVNQNMMAAAWYGLENCNASNKRIRHSLEELKALQGMLGIDIWFQARKRTEELVFVNQTMELKSALQK